MAVVTVSGASGSVLSLTFDTASNTSLAQSLANQINPAIAGGTLGAQNGGTPGFLSPGATSEFNTTVPGATVFPSGWDALVANNTTGTVQFYASSDSKQSVLAGQGNFGFSAQNGSGTVVAGAGNDVVSFAPGNTGAWDVNLGNGNNQVIASGSGNDSLTTGTGTNTILLGSGADSVNVSGKDVIFASTGSDTITASGSDLVVGQKATIDFVGGSVGATLIGGLGSDTFQGGSGTNVARAGSGGNSSLFGGTGQSTLYGTAGGDTVAAGGTNAQQLWAGSGAETIAGVSGVADVFGFNTAAGRTTDLLTGFTSASSIHLAGGLTTTAAAPAGGSTQITLSDGTVITLQNYTGTVHFS